MTNQNTDKWTLNNFLQSEDIYGNAFKTRRFNHITAIAIQCGAVLITTVLPLNLDRRTVLLR